MKYFIPAFTQVIPAGDLSGNKPSYMRTMLEVEITDGCIGSIEECFGIDESRIVPND